MDALKIIYWTRAALGLLIGILCGLYIFFSVSTELLSFYTLLTGLSFAILFYVATYYVLKFKFLGRVEKPSAIIKQGIGIYFFAWILSWTLIVTMLLPSISVSIYDDTGNLVYSERLWVLIENVENPSWIQNITTESGMFRITLVPPGTYTLSLGDTNQSQTFMLNWIESLNVSFFIPSEL